MDTEPMDVGQVAATGAAAGLEPVSSPHDIGTISNAPPVTPVGSRRNWRDDYAAIQARRPSPSVNVSVQPYIDSVAIRLYENIVEDWNLDSNEAATLLGLAEHTWATYQESLEAREQKLPPNQLLRISYVLGIYRALHRIFNEELAHRWPKMPNSNSLFANEPPLNLMLTGGPQGLSNVRDHLDASVMGW